MDRLLERDVEKMIEMDQVKLTKAEATTLVSKYMDLPDCDVKNIINIMEKIGIISEYIFKEEPKPDVTRKI